MNSLSNKRITVAVTGGIAVYKVCELVRLLMKEGVQVQVLMSKAACEFVTPLTFETLCGHPVTTELFNGAIPHIALTRHETDLLVVAPATANILAKAANGIADELVSSTILASAVPVVFVPAMNEKMWINAATQRNVKTLIDDGCTLIGPDCGDLACGVSATGRMKEPADILFALRQVLSGSPLRGVRAVVTAGPTYEAIDPVRGITNRSSGRQGYALALALAELGAGVTLVSGPTELPAPACVTVKRVVSAREMYDTVISLCSRADLFCGVAAVADWTVLNVAQEKIKKTQGFPSLIFERSPDILAAVSRLPNSPFCVGFAAETSHLEQYAKEKLTKKGIDLIVANNAREAIAAAGNTVTLYTQNETIELPYADKMTVARSIATQITRLLGWKNL